MGGLEGEFGRDLGSWAWHASVGIFRGSTAGNGVHIGNMLSLRYPSINDG